jgi:hypothetical protein
MDDVRNTNKPTASRSSSAKTQFSYKSQFSSPTSPGESPPIMHIRLPDDRYLFDSFDLKKKKTPVKAVVRPWFRNPLKRNGRVQNEPDSVQNESASVQEIINALHKSCKEASAFESNYMKFNKLIMKRIARLHDNWVQQTDVSALLKANYLIDYYCSNLMRACTMLNDDECKVIFRVDDTRRKGVYEVFNKTILPYEQGLNEAQNIVRTIAKTVVRLIRKGLRQSKQTDSHKYFTGTRVNNWDEVLTFISLAGLLALINKEVQHYTKYASLGMGMYRLINMKMLVDGSYGDQIPDKRPCNCICNALLIILVLKEMHYPTQHIFTVPQIQNLKEKVERWTHLSTVCKHPYRDILVSRDKKYDFITMDEIEIVSTYGFLLYTRDIVWYYDVFIKNGDCKVGNLEIRRKALTHLIGLFDTEIKS